MTDSLFTAENIYDAQISHINLVHSQMLLEATARRMVTVSNHPEAARRLYRIADICSVGTVVPLELLNGSGFDRPAQSEAELAAIKEAVDTEKETAECSLKEVRGHRDNWRRAAAVLAVIIIVKVIANIVSRSL